MGSNIHFVLDKGRLNSVPTPNVQVSWGNPPRACSESSLKINPIYPQQIVAASKKFTDPEHYVFTVTAFYSPDGGVTWNESDPLPLQRGWKGTSDPVVAWDANYNAYLTAVVFDAGFNLIGVVLYKSNGIAENGGLAWAILHYFPYPGADKPTLAVDVSVLSPNYGTIYLAWDDTTYFGPNDPVLALAYSKNGGANWYGLGGLSDAANPYVLNYFPSFAPSICLTQKGTVYVFFSNPVIFERINYFSLANPDDWPQGGWPKLAANVTTLDHLPQVPGGDHVLPGGNFRVETFASSCAWGEDDVVIAWADARDYVKSGGTQGVRVYWRMTIGGIWLGDDGGQPLYDTGPQGLTCDFHPQLASYRNPQMGGVDDWVACCHYRFNTLQQIDTFIGGIFDPWQFKVTDYSWDPKILEPVDQYGGGFIGDYFGFDASSLGFFPLWTDTNPGYQALFTQWVVQNLNVSLPASGIVLGQDVGLRHVLNLLSLLQGSESLSKREQQVVRAAAIRALRKDSKLRPLPRLPKKKAEPRKAAKAVVDTRRRGVTAAGR